QLEVGRAVSKDPIQRHPGFCGERVVHVSGSESFRNSGAHQQPCSRILSSSSAPVIRRRGPLQVRFPPELSAERYFRVFAGFLANNEQSDGECWVAVRLLLKSGRGARASLSNS